MRCGSYKTIVFPVKFKEIKKWMKKNRPKTTVARVVSLKLPDFRYRTQIFPINDIQLFIYNNKNTIDEIKQELENIIINYNNIANQLTLAKIEKI